MCQEAPRPYTSPENIESVLKSIKAAKKPLIIVGKGSAYAQAESELNKMVAKLKIPVLATPMGKGVVDDDHELSIAAARST